MYVYCTYVYKFVNSNKKETKKNSQKEYVPNNPMNLQSLKKKHEGINCNINNKQNDLTLCVTACCIQTMCILYTRITYLWDGDGL